MSAGKAFWVISVLSRFGPGLFWLWVILVNFRGSFQSDVFEVPLG